MSPAKSFPLIFLQQNVFIEDFMTFLHDLFIQSHITYTELDHGTIQLRADVLDLSDE